MLRVKAFANPLLTKAPTPPDMPAETSPSITAPTCASRSRSWSKPSRSPLAIWTRWISAPKLAKTWLTIWWLGTVTRNQAMSRRMARLRIALKTGIHFREAPKVNLAVAMAQVISAMSWATWTQTIATM
ncbi:hypothetical protein [Nocardiopsis lambiniae]|uniref:Transposase n=1 Tax=Nocardiopsis lambiniae TaxID=3075539 RepID=A0ABU2M8Q0_9ACTN|nr:hypothetical protein [Nocardiopsis sp. DSM 44743]MDT0328535.1 hypothetical protein [Nocardiopsis sp. DSM 44743]